MKYILVAETLFKLFLFDSNTKILNHQGRLKLACKVAAFLAVW